MRDWCEITEVKLMGSLKAVITFDSKESMQVAEQSPFLLNHFIEVRQWSPEESNVARRVWLEIYGLPIHVWNETNMIKIGEVWGRVIKVNARSEEHYSSFSVLVDTDFGPTIQSRLRTKVEDEEFLLEWVYEKDGDELIMNATKNMERVDGGNMSKNEGTRRRSTGGNETSKQGTREGAGKAIVAMLAGCGDGLDDSNNLQQAQLVHKTKRPEEVDDNQSKTKTWDDDRLTEDVVRETQIGDEKRTRGDNLVGRNKYGTNDLQELEDTVSGPEIPPGFDPLPGLEYGADSEQEHPIVTRDGKRSRAQKRGTKKVRGTKKKEISHGKAVQKDKRKKKSE
ncbi:hypothetical protein PIB30_100873 [Stylosanthes scabra]|uniref:DUF4283 domain-containing protein n=1 Tax=Stylosanthes scabra TaxID=79078 RepID=A0ABU6ZW67_9FABA|nr:hypothetical protein [Stylosanthes scabra]